MYDPVKILNVIFVYWSLGGLTKLI